jgi:hypothetical protein
MKFFSVRWLWLIAFSSFVFLTASAQDFNNYKTLKSSGNIPQKFVTSSTEKYLSEIKTHISEKDKNRIKRDKKKFLLESSFAIDELLLSGKVLYNDPVSVYCGRVLDELLKDRPDLRSKIEVYAVKSTSVNAFTTNSGIIFVTLGLVAQMENEAQLAYVLSHEVIHFEKQHALTGYIEKQNINRKKGVYRSTTLEERLLAKSNYSKNQETEADLEGLQIFLKSNYSMDALDGVFDVLEYSHLPFDEVTFQKRFLESANMKFPEKYFLEKTKVISADDEDDSLGTHPGVKIRRQAVKEKIEGLKNDGRKLFLVDKNEFFRVQKISRFELCSINLQYREYEAAIYNCFLLMQDDSNSKYLRKCLNKALYGLSKYANAGRFSEVHENYEDVQGSSQQVYYLFDKFTIKEINVVAMVNLWKAHKYFPEDREMQALSKDVLHELVNRNFKDKDYFSTMTLVQLDSMRKAKKAAAARDSIAEKSSNHKETKLEKIKKRKEEAELDDDDYDDDVSFTKYALSGMLKDPEFSTLFNQEYVDKNDRNNQKKKHPYDVSRDYDRSKGKRFKGLGIDKMVFVNPIYFSVDETSTTKVQYLESEAQQHVFSNTLKEMSQRTGLDAQVLDKKDLVKSGTDMFNDLSVLNAYMDECYLHEKDDEDMHFINYLSDDLQAIPAKYGSKYFCWTWMVELREKKELEPATYCFCIIPPLIPFIAVDALRKSNNTYFYAATVNLENGQRVNTSLNHYKYRSREDINRSAIYDLLYRFKHKKK